MLFMLIVNNVNGVTGLAKNSVSQETGYGYIKEGSGKTERPLATILLKAAYGLLNSSSFAFACFQDSNSNFNFHSKPGKAAEREPREAEIPGM
jgi:hypothetical protein